MSAFAGEISNAANALSLDTSATRKLRYHEIFYGDGGCEEKTAFRFVDTMGIKQDYELHKDDIDKLMKGHIKNQYNFKKGSPISPDDPYYRERPQIEDRMHVVVIVLDGVRWTSLNDNNMQALKNIIDMARDQDLPIVLLITKIDDISPEIEKDVTTLYCNKELKEIVGKASHNFGIRLAEVWPVQNFSSETQVEWEKCHVALQALEVMLNRASAGIRMMSEEGYAP